MMLHFRGSKFQIKLFLNYYISSNRVDDTIVYEPISSFLYFDIRCSMSTLIWKQI